jgi:hypothetical protein
MVIANFSHPSSRICILATQLYPRFYRLLAVRSISDHDIFLFPLSILFVSHYFVKPNLKPNSVIAVVHSVIFSSECYT